MTKRNKRVTVKATHQSIFSFSDLCKLFENEIPPNAQNVRIYIEVPSGGDCSGQQLEIGSDIDNLYVEWTTVQEKQSDGRQLKTIFM